MNRDASDTSDSKTRSKVLHGSPTSYTVLYIKTISAMDSASKTVQRVINNEICKNTLKVIS